MEPYFYFGLFCAVGAFFGWRAWYLASDGPTRRKIRGATRRRVSDVLEGERVRVVGRVAVDTPIAAPLSKRPCAYWRVVVEQRRSSGQSSARKWITLVDEEGGVDFTLTDDSGKALVRTSYTRAVLESETAGTSGLLNDPAPELEAFLVERGHSTQGWVFNKSIRYREGIAEPGETVAVVGTGRWERDPDEAPQGGAGYRDAVAPTRLVLNAPEGGPLLLSDQPDLTR